MRIISPSFEIMTAVNDEMLLTVEKAARTCYKSENKITPGSAQILVRNLIARGHEAMLEHVGITVKFICDRGISHEIVRHRLFSFAQESTRYVNYGGKSIEFICPPGLSTEQIEAWELAMINAEMAYDHMISLGCKPEIARSILPNSLKTELVVTGNIREWRHFLRLRTDKPAHPQMRQITIPLLTELQNSVMVLFDDIKVG